MCGLVGVLRSDRARVPVDVVARMADTLAHRGPDDAGSYHAPGIGLHHRRLAIIDLATGHQPMTVEHATTVFNGEIYNYVELRDELIRRGHAFTTTSDTEVLLRGYLAWGNDVVRRLNGMFAFLLVDESRRTLLAARDHFGVKPLYYARVGDALVYASEIKALLRWPEIRAHVDASALQEYVTFQHTLDDATLFAGIRKLLPAHLQVVSLDDLATHTERYWAPDFSRRRLLSEEESVAELRALLVDSARLQTRSDVPLGAYLSGGLDSSTVATLGARFVEGPMQVFTGAFREGLAFDESGHAEVVAKAIGARAHVVYADETEFVDLLPRLAWHMDEPAAGPGLFPQFVVSRLAARHVKVCLGGQGGDELFGGYARYLVAGLEASLRAAITGSSPEGDDAVPLAELCGGLRALEQYRPMLERFVAEGFLREAPERRYFRLLDRTEGTLAAYSPAFRQSYSRDAMFERFRAAFDRAQTRSMLDRMTAFDLANSLPALLQVEDRVSMAVSLESRVPLLDPRIADLLASLSPRQKYRGGALKHLFKRAVEPWLPRSIVQREDKMGFPVPLHLWSSRSTRDFLHDTLLSSRCRQRGLYDPVAVERLMADNGAFGRTLWGLLQIELWHRAFIDRPPA